MLDKRLDHATREKISIGRLIAIIREQVGVPSHVKFSWRGFAKEAIPMALWAGVYASPALLLSEIHQLPQIIALWAVLCLVELIRKGVSQ